MATILSPLNHFSLGLSTSELLSYTAIIASLQTIQVEAWKKEDPIKLKSRHANF